MSHAPVSEQEKEWDAFTLAHGGNFLQSWGWARFQEALGRETYRATLEKPGGGRAAQYVAIVLPLLFGRKYAYVPRGPIVDVADPAGDAGRIHLETCIAMLREKAVAAGAVFTRVEWPYREGASPVSAEDLDRWGFEAARSRQPAHTSILDLRKSEEELLAGMHHKTRYNIRVAERHGVTVRDAAPEEIGAFWRMLAETAARDNFSAHEERYYRVMTETLRPGIGGLAVRLVLAEREGKAIAGALLAEYGGTVTYLHGASVAAERRVMAPYLLHWTIIRDAKRAGSVAYDFWGVAPDDGPEHPWAGITRFKVGFGGERASYLGAWELPGNPFWYTLYRYAKRLRG